MSRKEVVKLAAEAQLGVTANYQKEKVRQVSAKFFPADIDSYEQLMTQSNCNSYMNALFVWTWSALSNKGSPGELQVLLRIGNYHTYAERLS